jgi:hypothetical protein
MSLALYGSKAAGDMPLRASIRSRKPGASHSIEASRRATISTLRSMRDVAVGPSGVLSGRAHARHPTRSAAQRKKSWRPTTPYRVLYSILRSLRMHQTFAGLGVYSHMGSALHVMLFLENLIRALLIFNGLRSSHCQRALLGYHYPTPLIGIMLYTAAHWAYLGRRRTTLAPLSA